jgi:hypothetical protein
LDGPAIEWNDGHKQWYINGKLHRLDGPAIERADGYKQWWIDGKLHRLDGPAIEAADRVGYWIDGVEYTKEEFIAKTQGKELTVAEIEKLLGYSIKIIKD